jgi:hypothetical protein
VGREKMNLKTVLISLALIVAIALATIVAGQIAVQYLFPTSGVVASATLDVTWVTNSSAVTSIDWGSTENGVPYDMIDIKITNTGNIPVTLSISTQGQSASITTLLLTWDYDGVTPIGPSASVTVVLEQTITATAFYSYTTVITATET